jgi:hypothetical protein
VFCDYRIHPYINSILFVSISFTVVSTKLWKSNYSPYQQGLFDRIRELKDNVFTPLGYRKIAHLLNKEGYKTPRGAEFKNNHVHSIYKKGMIRKNRMESIDKVDVLDTLVQVCYPQIKPH